MKIHKPLKRFWELDFLRGLAIISMIIFHVIFDLHYFDILEINVQSDVMTIFRILIFGLFFLLVGISLSLSYAGSKKFKKYLIRGVEIFFWGMLITLSTVIFLKSGYIVFGVLHFIGLSVILAYPFLKYSYLNLVLGIVIIITGLYLFGMQFDFNWLVWLGFIPRDFYTLDYYPILPYFGVILIGIFLGKKLYPNHKRKFNLKDSSNNPVVNFVELLGENSLLIYLVHQPVIIGVLLLIKWVL